MCKKLDKKTYELTDFISSADTTTNEQHLANGQFPVHRHRRTVEKYFSLTVMRFMSSCLRWSTQRRTACLYHVSRATGFPSRVSSERERDSPRQASWSKLQSDKEHFKSYQVKVTHATIFAIQNNVHSVILIIQKHHDLTIYLETWLIHRVSQTRQLPRCLDS